MEQEDSRQKASPALSSSSSSASKPRGQFLGKECCFWWRGRSKRASESDSAERASWEGMGWSMSWKKPC